MTSELDEMLHAIHNNQVPKIWKNNSYPCLLPLNEWLADFYKRVIFFLHWLENGEPLVFWLPGNQIFRIPSWLIFPF